MEWRDTGIVLGSRRHEESHAVVELFTKQYGRSAGLVYGGQSPAKKAILQPGNRVAATWKGRIATQLGHYTLELIDPGAAELMADKGSVLALQSICSLIISCLPEGEADQPLYDATQVTLAALSVPDIWPVILAKWELGLLSSLGFALDLSRCAVTGRLLEDGADLVFVSPKSGRAVTAAAGAAYREKLFPLPPFLIDRGEPVHGEVIAAFELTGFFLEKVAAGTGMDSLPPPRQMLMAYLKRQARSRGAL